MRYVGSGKKQHPLYSCMVAAVFVLIVFFIRLFFQEVQGVESVNDMGTVLFVIPIILASLYAGLTLGVLVTVLSTVIIWVFFLPVYSDFAFVSPTHTYILVAFFVQGVFISMICDTVNIAFDLERRSKEELGRSERRFLALYKSNLIAIIYANQKGQILSGNDMFTRMVGYTHQQLAEGTVTWKTVVSPEYTDDIDGVYDELNTKGMTNHLHCDFLRSDGARISVILGTVIPDYRQDRIVGFALDVTEEKKMGLRKEEFTRVVSHELKTPLTVVTGYMQLLERMTENQPDHKIKTILHKTNTYINRINHLVLNLLTISKIKGDKLLLDLKTLNICDIIQEAIDSTPSNHSGRIKFEPCAAQFIYGDRHKLTGAIINLLDNAYKYSAPTSEVSIEATLHEGMIHVCVQDVGIGIGPSDLSKIFDRFHRVEQHTVNYSGFGIGLYITREIIREHGGEIWVESVIGQGSKFTFTLPILSVPL